MEGWTIPETITAGSVVVFALVIIYRFLGQRTDPKLLELFELQTNAAAKRDEDNSKDNERLAEALDRNTEALNMVKSGVGSFARSIRADGIININRASKTTCGNRRYPWCNYPDHRNHDPTISRSKRKCAANE